MKVDIDRRLGVCGGPNAVTQRIEVGGDLLREVDAEFQLSVEFQATGRDVWRVSQFLRHFQNFFACLRVHALAVMQGAIHCADGYSKRICNLFDPVRLVVALWLHAIHSKYRWTPG